MPRITIAVLVALLTLATTTRAEPLTPEALKFFETKIRPVLVKECYGCHSSQSGNVRGGLRLDTRELTLIGGSSGPAVVPGDLEESLLYSAILHEGFEMPPKRMLSPQVIDDFRQWIEMGAPDPRETRVAEIHSTITAEDIQQAKDSFWAYQSPLDRPPPAVQHAAWPKTDIDRFILAKLEASGLAPAEDAPAYKVLRRLTFDLIGLPPTPRQIESFHALWSQDPDRAIARAANQLLEQQQFGERWGRHWLDVARYAESTGREVNMTYPHAWRYRDYVIDAFHEDKPFNEFVQEQIAGDLMPAATDEIWAEHLVATTFLAMGPKNVNEQNRVQFAADLVDEQIDATTRVFLGMSVACARCHDHKFDAIPQTDYYAMAGLFGNMTTYFGNPPSEFGSFNGVQARRNSSLLLLPVDDPNPFDKRYTRQELDDLRSEMAGVLREAAEARRNRPGDGNASQNAVRNRIRTANRLAELSAKLAVVDDDGNPRSYCMGVQEQGSPQNARLLVRGEIDQAAQVVARGFPQVLCSAPAALDPDSSGRLELARWIGSEENPLTARVMVNRIWQHLIGQGIVTSTENFGVTGQAPSHPELLDHLATRFVKSGWSVKQLIRDIVSSRVYRIDSTFDPRSHEYDPDNALLWRANPRRLEAEVIRDAMLSVSGEIDLQRPRGSEVAKAGYTRVRDGVLGDPRQAAERVGQQMRQAIRERLASGRQGYRPPPGAGPRFGPGPLGQGPRAGGRFFPAGPGRRGPLDSGRSAREMFAATADEIARRVTGVLDMEEATFRSVYLPIVRDEEPRSLEVFDFADANTVTGTRETSNTANQALYLLNNRFVISQSEAFARRIADHSPRLDQQIESAFLLAYSRPPTAGERSATSSFLKSFRQTTDDPEDVLAAFCQSLFAAAEFRYID